MEDTEQRKNKLINRLREKMKLPSNASAIATCNSHSRLGVGNKNAEKKTRKIGLTDELPRHYVQTSKKAYRRWNKRDNCKEKLEGIQHS